MASPLGIDLGNVYRTAEAIKQSRFLRGAQEADAKRQGEARNAASRFASGDQSAFGELVSLDPKMANDIVTSFNAMDAATKKAKQDEVSAIGQLAAGILSAKDPAAAYAQTISELPPEAAANFPETYNEDWVRAQLGRATEVSKIYEKLTGDEEYTRERTDKAADTVTSQQNALELVEANANADIKVATAKNVLEGADVSPLESADSNAIYRQAAELFGGVFDQAGNLQGLDPNTRSKVQEVATRASKYFGGGMSHAEAVKKAAQELGVTFPGDAPPDNVMAAPANPSDPAGLFN